MHKLQQALSKWSQHHLSSYKAVKSKSTTNPYPKHPFFSHGSNPQITISNKTLHHNNNKVSKIPKAQNPIQQKVPKFELNYYITSFPKPIRTNHHHHPDTQHNNNKQNNKTHRSEYNRSLEKGKKNSESS